MSVRLVRAQDPVALLDALAAEIERRPPPGTLPRATTILIPGPHVGTAIRCGIAERNGIATAINTFYLTSWIAQLCQAADRKRGDGLTHRILDGARLTHVLAGLLADPKVIATKEMAPLAAYLAAHDGGDKKRVRLAARLARLFEEYAYQRPAMIGEWLAGARAASGESEVARWQSALFNLVFGSDGWRAQAHAAREVRWLWPPYLASDTKLIATARLSDVLPERLHIFGFTHMARSVIALLDWAAASAELHVYSLAPQESAAESDVHPLIGAWGEATFDHQRALGALAVTHPAIARASVRSSANAQSTTIDDKLAALEIEWHACPSMRREVEVLATRIWSLVSTPDPHTARPLAFRDIAVFVGPRQAREYGALIAEVFAEHHKIPHTFAPGLAAHSDRVVALAARALAVLAGRLTRSEVLEIMLDPLVLQRFADATRESWLALASELAFFHGAGAEDRQGTHIKGDLYSLEHGLRRLALGTFMAGVSASTGARTITTQRVSAAGLQYTPLASAPGAGGFLAIGRLLIENARRARHTRATLADWGRAFCEFIKDLIGAPPPDSDEYDSLHRVLDQLDALGELDEIAITTPRAVEFKEALHHALARLDAIALSGGSGGVTVAALAPERPLAHAVIFMLGMGEGLVPATPAHDALDLREDELGAAELERAAVLEAVLSARRALVFSYVSRDSTTGDALEASSIVLELQRALSQRAGRELGPAVQHPLDRIADVDPFAAAAITASPSLLREARVAALASTLPARPERIDREWLARLDPDVATKLAPLIGLCRVDERARLATQVSAPGATIRISLSTLRAFLDCPLQGVARFALGLRDDELDGLQDQDDEPFAASPREAVPMLRAVFQAALAAPRDQWPVARDRELEERAQSLEIAGQFPTGVLLQAERERWRVTLDRWRRHLDEVAPREVKARLQRVSFGAAADALNDSLVRMPAIRIELQDGRIAEIAGTTGLIAPGGGFLVGLDDRMEPKERPHTEVGAFIDMLAIRAAGVTGAIAECATKFQLIAIGGAAPLRAFADRSATAAHATLTRIANDLLTSRGDELMPCAAVHAFLKKPEKGSLEDHVEALFEKGIEYTATGRGPIRSPERFAVPDDHLAKIAGRFPGFFDESQEDDADRAGDES